MMSQRQLVQGEDTPAGELYRRLTCSRSVSLLVLVPAVFEQYQKSRLHFVQTVADLASRPQNVELLQNAGKKNRRCPVVARVHLTCPVLSRCGVPAASTGVGRGAGHPADCSSGSGPAGGPQRQPGRGRGGGEHPASAGPVSDLAERERLLLLLTVFT